METLQCFKIETMRMMNSGALILKTSIYIWISDRGRCLMTSWMIISSPIQSIYLCIILLLQEKGRCQRLGCFHRHPTGRRRWNDGIQSHRYHAEADESFCVYPHVRCSHGVSRYSQRKFSFHDIAHKRRQNATCMQERTG